MKNLIMLFALVFSFATLNAQDNAVSAKQEMKKSCSKECSKSCCASKAEAKKSCSKTKTSCSKTCTGISSAYVKTVNAKDFMTYADKFPAEQIIDIRTPEEVKSTGMVEGAININYNNSDEFKMKMNELDKNAAVMIYCNSGKRSSEAISLLKMWGFKKIYEMEGGYKEYMTVFPKG